LSATPNTGCPRRRPPAVQGTAPRLSEAPPPAVQGTPLLSEAPPPGCPRRRRPGCPRRRPPAPCCSSSRHLAVGGVRYLASPGHTRNTSPTRPSAIRRGRLRGAPGCRISQYV